ncbi:hypothetical protein ACHAQA_003901 [Verticillium albo-atrum]
MVQLSLGQTLVVFLSLASESLAKDWLSPEYKWLYQYPLPIPPVKQEKWPSRPITNPVTKQKVKYYEIEIKEFEQQVYPNKKPTKLVGYDGISPGPTFLEERDGESVVRFTNHAKMANSVHLHGSYSRTPFDGWAEDTTEPGEYKDYYYPNCQNGRTMWYHDHAIDHTAENAYFGQAGAYLVHDAAEDALGLPSGYGKYDIPMILSAKQYNSDGSLFSPANVDDSLYGDVIHVNGQPWPYFKVEPRKYRFRFLNAAISRTFFLYFESSKKAGTKLDFQVIASDTGLLTSPQNAKDLYISMAERYEVIFDFSNYKGQNVTLRNTKDFAPDKDFLHTDKVMRFVVAGAGPADSSNVPSALRQVDFPKHKEGIDHHFLFHRQGSDWRINGVTFADVKNRVLAKPKRGLVEVWELENSSGGWSHPIHIHLVDFRVLKRTGGKRQKVFNYEAQGLKDVVWLGPGETVTVEAHYAPWPGVYMFHCHNLIHEDHEMMAAFNVSVIEDLGYPETAFADPMQADYRARKEIAGGASYDSVKARVEELAKLEPYNHHGDVDGWLSAYYATKGNGPAAVAAPTQTVTTVTTAKPAVATAAKATTTKKTTTTKKARDLRFHARDLPKRTDTPEA